jgi:hypothetical protein
MKPAVLVMCYDRPHLALGTLRAIRAHEGPILIFQDGEPPGGAADEMREIAHVISQERKSTGPTILHQEERNLGQRDAPIKAIGWAAETSPSFIVLEEDILPAPKMVEIYSKALAHFEHDPTIFALGASKLCNPKNQPGPKPWTRSPLFLVWGWASWKNRIDLCQVPNRIWQERGPSLLEPTATLLAKLYLAREMGLLAKNPHYCWSYYLQLHCLHHKLDILVPETKLAWNRGIHKGARHTQYAPDEPWTNPAVDQMARKAPGANPKNKAWEKELEQKKFVSLLHELRARLAIRQKIQKLTKKTR